MRTTEHISLLRQEAANLKKDRSHYIDPNILINAAFRMEQMNAIIDGLAKKEFYPVVCVSYDPAFPEVIVDKVYKIDRLSISYDDEGNLCGTVYKEVGKEIGVMKLSCFRPDNLSSKFSKMGYSIPKYITIL